MKDNKGVWHPSVDYTVFAGGFCSVFVEYFHVAVQPVIVVSHGGDYEVRYSV